MGLEDLSDEGDRYWDLLGGGDREETREEDGGDSVLGLRAWRVRLFVREDTIALMETKASSNLSILASAGSVGTGVSGEGSGDVGRDPSSTYGNICGKHRVTRPWRTWSLGRPGASSIAYVRQ